MMLFGYCYVWDSYKFIESWTSFIPLEAEGRAWSGPCSCNLLKGKFSEILNFWLSEKDKENLQKLWIDNPLLPWSHVILTNLHVTQYIGSPLWKQKFPLSLMKLPHSSKLSTNQKLFRFLFIQTKLLQNKRKFIDNFSEKRFSIKKQNLNIICFWKSIFS